MMAYLRTKGWTQESEISNKASLWVLPGNHDLTVPARRELGDYTLRVSEVLSTLSRVEDRSQLEVLRDIQTTSADLVRIRATNDRAEAGALPLEDAVRFVENTREMFLSAACAAIEKRPVYAKRKPQAAMDYLRHVQLGQTERGSFVLTVLSPVRPELRPVQTPLLPQFEPEDPYERKVTKTLFESLGAINVAARSALLQSDMQPFQNAIGEGVSANLCDSLVGLASVSSSDRLEMQISWARTRPISAPLHTRVVFESDTIPVIQEAARVFREVAPIEDVEVAGFVVGTGREITESQGDITLDALLDGSMHRIVISLGPEDYSLALKAHDERRVVMCVGDLAKQGRGFRLQNPRYFKMLDPDSNS
jgi:hypothetical protein